MAQEISIREKQPDAQNQLPARQVSWRATMARYVVVVDGQAKSSFAEQAEADAEAKRIRTLFPVVSVKVTDWTRDSVHTLGATQMAPEAADQ